MDGSGGPGIMMPSAAHRLAGLRAMAPTCLRPGEGQCRGRLPAATRALPRDIATFTGRQVEFAQLMGTLAAAAPPGGVVRIYAIDGMAGVGKTALAVHAAHRPGAVR